MVYKDGFLEKYFLDKEITLQDTTWSIDSFIQEHPLKASGTAEAVAVFRCMEIEPNPGTLGIIKIRASIPEDDEPEDDENKEMALNALSILEPRNLQILTDAECSSAPKLLAQEMFRQTDDMCDPEGYVVCIVMEALPGEPLDPRKFWGSDRGRRDIIREAFRKAITEVGNCGIEHWDAGIQNLLWDETRGKCYIVDFENSENIAGTDFEWDELYWVRWGLSHNFGGPEW
ncbi:hypothetical protein FQN54_001647 [Arachnomyces sp. PD_36]|nr:hypothetical protein FQN54_001647 [Arachnomyces sp. PD_36]